MSFTFFNPEEEVDAEEDLVEDVPDEIEDEPEVEDEAVEDTVTDLPSVEDKKVIYTRLPNGALKAIS